MKTRMAAIVVSTVAAAFAAAISVVPTAASPSDGLPGASPSATASATTYDPGVVLITFDHTLSDVDQERFELRHSVHLLSLDTSDSVYRFSITDGIDAAWKADSIRKGTEDGVTWAGTTADHPPASSGSPTGIIAGVTAGLVAVTAGAISIVFRRRSRMTVGASAPSSARKSQRTRSDRSTAARHGL